MQTTSGFAEICLRIPNEKKATVQKIITNMLTKARIDFFIQTDRQDNNVLPLDEVFPDLHPGSAIKGLRYREDMTQAKLAEKIGVMRHHISEMENGKRPIGKEMAKRMAKVLKTDYRIFL